MQAIDAYILKRNTVTVFQLDRRGFFILVLQNCETVDQHIFGVRYLHR